uniref:Uncharacterized protein n=1 Tax=Panagrolaimus sp. ES5 TaxID=591445 RepID=A0AC34GPS1_9BILA
MEVENNTINNNNNAEGAIDYWCIIDVEKLMKDGERLKCDPYWVSHLLQKGDQILCVCKEDSYYYCATVKKIKGTGVNREFFVGFQDYKWKFDETFDFASAAEHFLECNVQTLKFIKAYNESRLAKIKKECAASGKNNLDELKKFVPNGISFLKRAYKADGKLINDYKKIRYPPRYSVSELLLLFNQQRSCFDRLRHYSIESFIRDISGKIKEYDFVNEVFRNDEESQAAISYCNSIKVNRGIPAEEDLGNLCYHFGIIHLIRYLYWLNGTLTEAAETEESDLEEDKRYLVHELSYFIFLFKKLYYSNNDYVPT